MKILAVSYVHPDTVAVLERDHDLICNFKASNDDVRELIVDREMIIFRSGVNITGEIMALAPNLRYVIRAGSGLDNVDLDYIARNNLELFRIPEPGARAVGEITFGFMISMARQVRELDIATRKGNWMKLSAEGYLLRNKTLGIIGVGNIGGLVAKMGSAWDMKIIGCVEFPTQEKREALQKQNVLLTDLETVLKESDFIAVHVPLKDSTRNLIDEAEFSMMKEGVYLVNMARGGVVNEEALAKALTSGQVRAAALDVHKNEGEGKISPLVAFPNVILTPHIGAQTMDTQREIGERIQEIVQEVVSYAV